MRFAYLTMENVFSHHRTAIDLSDRGLCLITGENGSGKSSILKSLLFVLFGIGTDSVVNNIVGKDACVTLIGNKNNSTTFGISRYRKHSKHKNNLYFFIDGNPVDASTNMDLQRKLEQFLGLDYRSFLNVAAFSSEMVQFCSSTDVERKAIFEKILQDLDVYNEFYSSAKEELAGLSATIEAHKHGIDIEERELTIVKKVIEAEEEKSKEFEEKRKEEIEKIETELVELDKKAKLRRSLEERKQKYKAVADKLEMWLEDHPFPEEMFHTTKFQLVEVDAKLETLAKHDRCLECNQLITKEHKWQEKIRLEEMKSIFSSAVAEFEIVLERTRKVSIKHDEVRKRVEEIRFKLTKYDSLLEKIQDLEEELESVRESTNGGEETLQKWRSKAKKVSKKIASYKRNIKQAEEEQLYLEEITKGFSKTGIPNVIISRALHLLEERTNVYLEMLTSGAIGVRLSGFTTTKKGAVRNKIDIEVVSATGVTTYESYSGGERQRLNIAMLLALRDVAQANKGVDLGCLFLDEVLDLSLDSAGIGDVMMLLQHKKKDIPSIFIISPKDELIQNASGNFDSAIRVSKEGGFSKLIGD